MPPPACNRSTDQSQLTHVTLLWRRDNHEDWLRFGEPVCERILDRRRRMESYAPRKVFALVRWASNDYGTIHSSLDIVRAVGADQSLTRLPQVAPGGDLLLSVRGWSKVSRVFGLIDAIEESGIDPCEVAPDHWRHVHNRLAARLRPRAYDLERHRAWLARQRLGA